MLTQPARGADPNEELWAKSRFTHTPGANATAHRMADEDVHRSKCPISLPKIEIDVGLGTRLRRFSKSRQIHGVALETSGGELLAETKQHFFRAAISMSEQRNRMRAGRCGENSKRGGVCGEH